MESWNILSYFPFIHQNYTGSRGILKRHNQKFKTQEKPLLEDWKAPYGLQISSPTGLSHFSYLLQVFNLCVTARSAVCM